MIYNRDVMWKFHLAFGLALFTSFCRAFRFPNPWSTAHWMITYDYGLVKRGLVGTIVGPLLEGKSQAEIQSAINLMASALTFVWCAVIIWLASGIISKCRNPLQASLAVIAVLMGPYAIMVAHINGYYDVIAFVLGAAACVCITCGKGNPFLAGCVLAISILCHETTLLYGAPAVAFAIVARYHQTGEWHTWRKLTLCGIPLGATFGYTLLARQSSEVLPQLLNHLKELGFTHGNHQMVAGAIVSSFEDPWHIMYPQILQILSAPPYPVQIGIPALALIALCASQFTKGSRAGMAALAAVCTLIPLAIHAMAWDTSRIWTYPLGNGFLILWASCQFGTEKSTEENKWLTSLCLLAVAVAIASQTPLMDSLVTRGTWQTALMGYLPALALLIWALPSKKQQLCLLPPRNND